MPVPAAVLRLLAPQQVVDLASDADGGPGAETAALLAFLASVTEARTMVEVGSAGGVTAGALVAGQRNKGVVTSIEADRAAHDAALARLAGPITEGRVRLMHGDIAEVLGRLTDNGYGLLLLQHDVRAYADLVDEAERLLAAGGLLLARGVLDVDAADDVAPFLQRVAELAVASTILDLDGGLLLATLR